MSQLLQACRVKVSLHTQEQIHNPTFGKHGVSCFLGGFEGDLLSTTTEHHDPQHKPYGICWSLAHGSATEQDFPSRSAQTKHESTKTQRAASSSGFAAQQPLQAVPAPAPKPETAMPARSEPENLDRAAAASYLKTVCRGMATRDG
jgi:hypothetical protein